VRLAHHLDFAVAQPDGVMPNLFVAMGQEKAGGATSAFQPCVHVPQGTPQSSRRQHFHTVMHSQQARTELRPCNPRQEL
jgi:hypothetical protein